MQEADENVSQPLYEYLKQKYLAIKLSVSGKKKFIFPDKGSSFELGSIGC